MKVDNEFFLKATSDSWYALKSIKSEVKKSFYFYDEESFANMDREELELLIEDLPKELIKEYLIDSLLQIKRVFKKSFKAQKDIINYLPKYLYSEDVNSVLEIENILVGNDYFELELCKYPEFSSGNYFAPSWQCSIDTLREATEEEILDYKNSKQKFVQELAEEKILRQKEDYKFWQSYRNGDFDSDINSGSSPNYCSKCQQSPCMCSCRLPQKLDRLKVECLG